jgi:hypothetical protein
MIEKLTANASIEQLLCAHRLANAVSERQPRNGRSELLVGAPRAPKLLPKMGHLRIEIGVRETQIGLGTGEKFSLGVSL